MAQCFDTEYNRYVYCTSHLTTYVAVGILIPLIILIIIALVYVYHRCAQRRLRRVQQQMYMTTINIDEQRQQAPYNYPYPPHYASVTHGSFDKPPPYEQTVQNISETNRNSVEDTPAILPATTSSEEPVEVARNPN